MEAKAEYSRKSWMGALGAPLIFLILWVGPFNIDATAQHALAVVGLLVVLWISEVVDHGVTAFLGCYLFWFLGIVDFNIAFSGFARDTPWFLFGALLIAGTASKTGLARRIAYSLMAALGTTFSRLLLGMILVSFLLNFIIPSGMAQIATLAPILIGLIAAFEVPAHSNIGRSLFVTLTYTSGLFNKMILAGSASLLARGLIESLAGVPVYWSQWLIAFLPVSLLTIVAIWRLVLWLYPPEKPRLAGAQEFLREGLQKLGPWSVAEKKAFVWVAVALSLWATDRLHHASPALIAMGVGLALCLPKIGVLETADIKKINFLPIIFVGGVLSMSRVLAETGALEVLTDVMFSWMAPLLSGFTQATGVLYWTAFAYHLLLASELSMLSTSIPALIQFATEQGLDPMATAMVWTFAGSGKIFVYQSAVLILGYSYGYFEPKDLFKVGAWMAAVEFILLLLLVSLYWPLIGLG